MTRGGIATREPDSLLLARARDFLAAGPASAPLLISAVCQLPGVPPAVADRLADTLLGRHPDFRRTACDRWALASWDTAAGAAGSMREPSPPAAGTLVVGSGTPTRADGAALLPLLPGAGADPLEPLDRMSFVVVDVETTGGRALGGDRITEFAAVVVRNGVIAETFETLVNPERPIPPWITQLTNISWEMVREAPRFRDVCADVLAVLGGHVFVAHNARFDWNFVAMEVARATGQELTGRQLCTVRLARRLLPQLRRRSLDHVAHHYAVGITARHRAMGDAYATAQVLLGLLRDAAGRGCATWQDLERLLTTSTSSRRRRRPSALPAPVARETTA